MTKQILSFATIGLTSFSLANIATSVKYSETNSYRQFSDYQEVIELYTKTNFNHIFNEDWNPGIKGLSGNKMTYDWTGAFGTPTWGKIKYQIPGGYCYFLTKILYYDTDYFTPMIKKWNIQNPNMPENLKIRILIALFNDYLRIGYENKYYDIFNGFLNSSDINKFIVEVSNFITFTQKNPVQFIRNTLTGLIKNMSTDNDSYWVKDYIVDEYTKNGEDKAYDGGVNFFIYYSSTYPTFFQSLLMEGICENCQETSQRTHNFQCPRTFWSERTSGASNFLSCLQYEFSLNKVEVFNYRPGRDIYN